MKKHQLSPIAIVTVFAATLVLFACKKNAAPPPSRVIRYVLYTKQDFSHVFDTIRFRIYMAAGNRTLLDSNLAPMTIAAIPDSAHALVFRKNVPAAYEQAKLAVGFFYAIDNVGASWWLDSSVAGQSLKTIAFPFQ